MNLGDVKTRVKRQFGDESGVQITDEDITRWANDCIQYIVTENEGLLEKIDVVDLVAGQQDYTPPTDLLTLKAVHIKPREDALSYTHIQGYDLQKFDAYVDGWDGTFYGPGTPYVYTIYAELLKIFPIPDSSAIGGLKFFYNRKPVLLAETDDSIELDLPPNYHNAVVSYCLQQAYELDENMDSYSRKGADVEGIIKLNRYRQGKANEESYPKITLNPEDAW